MLLGVLVGIPLLLLLWESYRAGRTIFLKQLKAESLHVAELEEGRINLLFEPPRLVAEGLARSLGTAESLNGELARELLRQTFRENPRLFGAGVFLDPMATPLGRFAPYLFRKDGVETEITIPYEYTRRKWYQRPVEAGAGRWVGPFFDRGGVETLMVTHGVPIRRQGRIVGVATIDLDIDGLVSRLRRIRPGGGGTLYLVSRDGAVLAHPDLDAIVDFGDLHRLGKLEDLLKAKGKAMTEMKDPVSGKRSWIVKSPVESISKAHGGGDWSLVVSWPLDARLAPLNDLAIRMVVLYLFLGGTALVILNSWFDQVVSRPLGRLSDQARRYAQGDFARPPRGRDAAELKELWQALDSLGETLEKGDRSPKPP